MGIAGQWTLFYSFGCSAGYGQTTITFDSNGMFTTGDGFSGQWASLAGDVQFVYEPAQSAVYAGNVIGGAMNGMMTNFRIKTQGCWYATTSKIPANFASERKLEGAEAVDSSGVGKR
ncbi:MAG TPA: hypothetical protein VG345_01485 [Bryobacteraceae bacterium]|jgi:hypothetical protein|nr:hypothetical protein [Bryobacteraceae bacterium]